LYTSLPLYEFAAYHPVMQMPYMQFSSVKIHRATVSGHCWPTVKHTTANTLSDHYLWQSILSPISNISHILHCCSLVL